jgi:hypothetical protein
MAAPRRESYCILYGLSVGSVRVLDEFANSSMQMKVPMAVAINSLLRL